MTFSGIAAAGFWGFMVPLLVTFITFPVTALKAGSLSPQT